MIFTKENIELIRQGKKTETRRIWKKPHVKVGKTYQCRVSRFTKTPEDSPYIKIKKICKERLKEIYGRPSDWLYEGCYSLLEFQNEWMKLHGSWNPEQEVYVIDFEVAK